MLPYMQKNDVYILDKLFESRKPSIVFEWGSGGSTVYFPAIHKFIEKWVSIGHDEKWATEISLECHRKNLSNVTVGYCPKIYHYIHSEFITEHLKIADFIIIDGIKRKECMEMAFEMCKENALVFLHDSGRIDYHAWFNIFPYCQKLTDGRVPNEQKGVFKKDGLHVFSKYQLFK